MKGLVGLCESLTYFSRIVLANQKVQDFNHRIHRTASSYFTKFDYLQNSRLQNWKMFGQVHVHLGRYAFTGNCVQNAHLFNKIASAKGCDNK